MQITTRHKAAVETLAAIGTEGDSTAEGDRLAVEIRTLDSEFAVVRMLEWYTPDEAKEFLQKTSSAYDGAFPKELNVAQLVYSTIPSEAEAL